MTRRAVALVALAALATACLSSGAAPGSSGSDAGRSAASGATGASGRAAAPGEGLPDPELEIPPQAVALARLLESTFARNRAAVAAWIAEGDTSAWPPPEDAVLLTLLEQRIVRTLVAHPALAGRVLERVSHRVGVETGANVRAGRAFFEHAPPVREVPDYRIGRPEPADALLESFREAEERFGVEWEVLAAVMLVESRMGRVRSRSSAGAQGPMQFLPATWEAYGLGGDVHDPHDAILGAANYLHASGAPEDVRAALYAYNPVNAYVTAVRQYARTMMRFPESYYVYYDWQVFVRTTDGDVRLSGPGS